MAARVAVMVVCLAAAAGCLASAGAAEPAKREEAKRANFKKDPCRSKRAAVKRSRRASGKVRRAERKVRRRKACLRRHRADTLRPVPDLPQVPGQNPGDPFLPLDPPANPDDGEQPVLGRSVQVRAREFSLTLSREVVAAGDVNVEFNTVVAEDPHDLWLRDASDDSRELFPETLPELMPPPRQKFAIAAGDYVLFCSLPGHETLGMSTPLAVR